MVDWFRNKQWSDEIATAFEDKLARARDKAQYLTLQGYTLLTSDPGVASALLRRAIVLDDPSMNARAWLYLGTALAVDDNLDGAISALENAMAEEERNPSVRTGAYLDHALMVALARRADLYDLALSRLKREAAMSPSELDLTSLIALALIFHERRENCEGHAREALSVLEALQAEGGELPSFMSPAMIGDRLRACL